MPTNAGNGRIIGSGGNEAFAQAVSQLEGLARDNTGQQGKGDSDVTQAMAKANRRAAENGVVRTPWVMSTTEWLKENKALIWSANPSDISWSMPQRSTHSKNLFGTVLHVWPDNFRDTFYDELKLTLSLQSGNIMPVVKRPGPGKQAGILTGGLGGISNPENWEVAPGLANFYDFMQLVDAPKLTKDGRANLVFIQYNSNLFPKLTLIGMFDSSGVRFTDSSQSPNTVTSWSADFIVYDTAPRLTSNSGQQSNAAVLEQWLQTRIKNMTGGSEPSPFIRNDGTR
jgi:hypothetical protein